MEYQAFSIKRLSEFFLLFFLYTLYFILYTSPVSAQQVSLSLSPSLIELAIKPGHSTTLRYKLNNIGDPAIVKISILPFEAKDNLGNIKISNSLQSPMHFELENVDIKFQEPFFLKNSGSEELFLGISVPDGTPAKDYYFFLLTESQPPPPQEGVANIRAKTSLASNLLITVTKEGEVEIKPKISLFEIIPKNKINLWGFRLSLFTSFEKIPVVLVVENKGKNLIKPRGEIILRGPFWQSKRFEIQPQNVLAQSQRQTSLELPGLFLGGYKLSSAISFGEDTPTLFASTSFVVLPIKFTILITIVIILVLFFWTKFRKD